jgi:hypothetical protein
MYVTMSCDSSSECDGIFCLCFLQALKRGEKPSETAVAQAPGLSWPKTKAELDDVGLLVIMHGLIFGMMSGGVFFLLGWVFKRLYGQEFVQEAFLHHVTRKDPR